MKNKILKTQQLILKLSENSPVATLFQPMKSFFLWFLIPFTVMLIRFLLWTSQSPSLIKQIDLFFFIESFVIAVLLVLVPYLTFKESVPGGKQRQLTWVAGLLLIFWVLLLFLRLNPADQDLFYSSSFFEGSACSHEILNMTILPFLIIFFTLKKGASIHPLRTGFMAAASSALMGVLVLQVICQSPSSLHVLIFHLGATLLISLVGAAIGAFYFRW